MTQNKATETLKKGQAVTGVLFGKGTVICTGTARSLAVQKYDQSGALREALNESDLDGLEPCIAVALEDGGVAVYVSEEVWPA